MLVVCLPMISCLLVVGSLQQIINHYLMIYIYICTYADNYKLSQEWSVFLYIFYFPILGMLGWLTNILFQMQQLTTNQYTIKNTDTQYLSTWLIVFTQWVILYYPSLQPMPYYSHCLSIPKVVALHITGSPGVSSREASKDGGGPWDRSSSALAAATGQLVGGTGEALASWVKQFFPNNFNRENSLVAQAGYRARGTGWTDPAFHIGWLVVTADWTWWRCSETHPIWDRWVRPEKPTFRGHDPHHRR